MYDASSTIPPVHLSQWWNVRRFIHHAPSSSTIPIVKCMTLHPPSPCSSTIPIVKCTTFYPPSPCSSTIPIVKCTTLHPPSPPFIYYPNSQMYDTSSTIPPVHLLPQWSNVRHFIHHPPSSSLIPIVKCRTLHPPSPLFIYYLNRQMYTSSNIYYPNSQMYDTSSSIPPLHLSQ